MGAMTAGGNSGRLSYANDLNWHVPQDLWRGRTAFILGGGPSLKGFDPRVLPGNSVILAINNAYRMAPWADALYWADRSWLKWGHVDGIRNLWEGGLLVTRLDPANADVKSWPIKVLKHERKVPLSRDPSAISGWCGGANAINLAYLASAEPIVLLGFDGRNSGNWHDDHKTKTIPDAYERWFAPALTQMAEELRKDKVEVWNATPDTALTCFPCRRLEDFL